MSDPQNALAALQQSLSQPQSPSDPGSQPPPQIQQQQQPLPQVFPQQKQSNVPSNKPGLPATFQLIKDFVSPSVKMGDMQQGPSRPVSRMDAFEGFLGNFMTSLASGFATPPGPGANMRAASAAAMAPLQANRQQFQLQQQANQSQAQLGQTQAQTQLAGAEAQKSQVEAQLAPIQLQFTEQIKQSQLSLENLWRQSMINQGQQKIGQGQEKIDLAKTHEQFQEDTKKQILDLQQRVETGKLNIAQEIARYKGMDTNSQLTYRSAMEQATQTKLIQAQQALNIAGTLKTTQAAQNAVKAANDYNMFARIGRSLGLEDDLGMPLPELNVPGVAIGGGAPTPVNNIPAGPLSSNPFRKPKKQ